MCWPGTQFGTPGPQKRRPPSPARSCRYAATDRAMNRRMRVIRVNLRTSRRRLAEVYAGTMSEVEPQEIGHIVLKVRDLERSIGFYTEVLGFTKVGEIGGRMAFFTATG